MPQKMWCYILQTTQIRTKRNRNSKRSYRQQRRNSPTHRCKEIIINPILCKRIEKKRVTALPFTICERIRPLQWTMDSSGSILKVTPRWDSAFHTPNKLRLCYKPAIRPPSLCYWRNPQEYKSNNSYKHEPFTYFNPNNSLIHTTA